MKLKWFEQKGWGGVEISMAKQLVRNHWVQDYALQEVPTVVNVPKSDVNTH